MAFCFRDLMPLKGGILASSECFVLTFVVGVTPPFLSEIIHPTTLGEKPAIRNLCEPWFVFTIKLELIALPLLVPFYL